MPKKKSEPRKKTDHIYGTTIGEVDHLILTVDELTGAISFGSSVSNTYLESSYERAKSPKITTRVPQGRSDLFFDATDAIIGNYDDLYAVDTNYKKINGKIYAATGFVYARPFYNAQSTTEIEGWNFESPRSFLIQDPKISPEKLGWLLALEYLETSDCDFQKNRIGIVVDSYLGDLKNINSRNCPIYGSYSLPSNCQLIYGSAETAKTNLINHVISAADRLAAACMRKIEQNQIRFTQEILSNYHAGIVHVNVNSV